MTTPPLIESKALILTNERLRLLAWGYYVSAGKGVFISMFFLMYAVMFGAFSFIPDSAWNTPQTTHSQSSTQPPPALSGKHPANADAPPVMVFRVFAGVMLAVTVVAWGLCGLTAYAGHCIQKRKHRIFVNIMAGYNAVWIPYGTALGVCTFLTINAEESKAQFAKQIAPPAVS